MTTITASKTTAIQSATRVRTLITSRVAAKLGGIMAVAALLLAIPGARGAELGLADKEFILATAQGGMTEIKLGELASKAATRDEVKDFGKSMVKDHTLMGEDLKALATQKGVTLPDSLDEKHQRMVDKMAALTGSEFDDAYIAAMTKDHKKVAKSFKEESARTKDTDIKGFLDKSLPVVERHLEHVTALNK